MRARCFLPAESWPAGRELRLTGREAHHLSRVLRVRKGESLLCFDGRGREAEAVVREIKPKETLLEMGPARQVPASACSISLGIAVPGQGKLEEIVNSSTQLGVRRILPLLTERTVVQFTPDRFDRKRAHLEQVSIEAAKQSGTSHLPEILPLTTWRQLLPTFEQYDHVLMATVEGPHEPLREILRSSKTAQLLLLIGPEGDFSPEEIRQGVQAGARRIGLGSSVLRCETAVVAALSIVQFVLRETDRP